MTANNKVYLSSQKVRDRYGISNMTLYRWERDPALNFPQPVIINGRKYQDEGKLQEWERSRAVGGRSGVAKC